MSTNSSPSISPIQPLHGQRAQIHVPQAPLGKGNGLLNATMGTKALLAKKLIRSKKPTTSSPTDNILTPCSAKLNQTKKKHFAKGNIINKPLFTQVHPQADEEEAVTGAVEVKAPTEETRDEQSAEPGVRVTEAEEVVLEEQSAEDAETEVVEAAEESKLEPVPTEEKKVNDENENPFAC